MMAKRLADNHFTIDGLVSSPAVRAKKTAEIFAEKLKIPKDQIMYISALYHADAEVFYEVIKGLPNAFDSVALFSHNPGITYFVNSLDSKGRVDNMPTCAIFALSVNISEWAGFSKAKKEFLFFDYPKNSLT